MSKTLVMRSTSSAVVPPSDLYLVLSAGAMTPLNLLVALLFANSYPRALCTPFVFQPLQTAEPVRFEDPPSPF